MDLVPPQCDFETECLTGFVEIASFNPRNRLEEAGWACEGLSARGNTMRLISSDRFPLFVLVLLAVSTASYSSAPAASASASVGVIGNQLE